jgi:hypothetical protein
MFYFLAYLPGLSNAPPHVGLLPLFQDPTDPRVVALIRPNGRLVHPERQSPNYAVFYFIVII